MTYIPKQMGARAPFRTRATRRIYTYVLSPAQNQAMGSLFGDILSGVKTAVVTSVNTGLTNLKRATVTTAQQETAAALSKVAIKALQKKNVKKAAPAAVPGTTPQAAPEQAPGGAPAAPAAVPGASGQVVYLPQGSKGLMEYLPYIAAGTGAVILVVVLARRGSK